MLNRTTIHAAAAVLAIFFSAALNNRAQAAFAPGDFMTYPQEAWGTDATSASSLLLTSFNSVYAGSVLEVGIPDPDGHSIVLTSASFALDLLPTIGPIRSLLADETNLPTTTSGTFGGDVLALQLNVDFSDAGFLTGTAGIPFGDLVLTDFDTPDPLLNGLTVRQFLADANVLLGGGTGIYTINEVAGVNDLLTNAFDGGTPSQFAQDHLTIVPEPATSGLALLALLGLASRRRRG